MNFREKLNAISDKEVYYSKLLEKAKADSITQDEIKEVEQDYNTLCGISEEFEDLKVLEKAKTLRKVIVQVLKYVNEQEAVA